MQNCGRPYVYHDGWDRKAAGLTLKFDVPFRGAEYETFVTRALCPCDCGACARAAKSCRSIWGGGWRDLVADRVAKKFTAKTGVQVDFITGGTINRLNKARLAKTNPESDITFTT
jgi:hypothetical protein